jgi:hypothetical protein
MQQLLVQHLQMPPNLDPSPPGDRPALTRALAKKPEHRFPSVSALVRALRDGGDSERTTAIRMPAPPPDRLARVDLPPPDSPPPDESALIQLVGAPRSDTPLPAIGLETPPPTVAPPEQTGSGPVRPALVVGVGGAGLRVLQRLRKLLSEKFGGPEKLPAVRFLYIDTDPDALAAATADRPGDGLAGLRPDEVFPAKLNRTGHYLKPRLNGRTLIEGWFDPQLLYKLPRTPVTMGLRPLGRLAFCDHYRLLVQRLHTELEACAHPDALADTTDHTGLGVRTNRPRVYVVAGLGGGTGGGMFLDLAYAARARLRRMGYEAQDVTGVLLVPPDAAGADPGPLAQANTYAALTELNHYARPDTAFTAGYDDRHGSVRDAGPPFTHTVLLPGPAEAASPYAAGGSSGVVMAAGASGRVPAGLNRSGRVGPPVNRSGYAAHPAHRSGVVRPPAAGIRGSAAVAAAVRDPAAAGKDPCAAAADYLRLDLFAPVGRVLDDRRPSAAGAGPVAARTFGLARYDWPRGEVVGRTARYVTGVVLDHWVTPNFGRSRQAIPAWAAEQFARLGLDPEGLVGRMKRKADDAVGRPVEALLAQTLDPLTPRGWRPKLPDPTRLTLAFAELDKLIGTPLLVANPPPNPVEDAARAAAASAGARGQAALAALIPGLVDDPTFRLAGAEEAVRQVLANIDRALARFHDQAARAEADARAAHELLVTSAHHETAARKEVVAEVTEALKVYPASQYQAVLARHAVKVYEHLKQVMVAALNEVSGCRLRLEGYRQALVAELEQPPAAVGPRQVMPPGCPTVEEAARKFLAVLTDEDLAELEDRIQAEVERTTGGLYQACLNTAEGAEVLLRVVREETRAYLDARLGDVDLAGMFAARFPAPGGVAAALVRAFDAAAPELVGSGPWARDAVTVVTAPAGAGGDPLRRLAEEALSAGADWVPADTPDEVVVYREYPHVPLTALPQCGPAWAAAYQAAAEQFQCTPHTRVDVTRWVGVDAD